jgi:hypothetical protein
MPADLHIHSIYSDGTFTPTKIVEEALRLGLSAIAISDHDTIGGLAEAFAAAEGSPLTVVPAVEINLEEKGEEIHILGYFLDFNSTQFLEEMERLRQSRINRIKQFVEKLSEVGVHLTLEEVLAAAGPGTVGRPHLAQTLVAKKYASDERDAFRRYLSRGSPTFVPRQHISGEEAVKIIRDAGGVPILAHPTKVHPPELVEEIIRLGIRGVEAFHPEHSLGDEVRWLTFAEEHSLLITGGSDYHGRNNSTTFSLGQRTCPDKHYLRLKAAAELSSALALKSR